MTCMNRRFLPMVLLAGCGGGQSSIPREPCVGEMAAAGALTSWLRASDGTIWQWGKEFGVGVWTDRVLERADWAFGAADVQQKGERACLLTGSNEVRCGVTPADLTTSAASAVDVKSVTVGVPVDVPTEAAEQDCVIKLDGSVWCWPAAAGYLKAA